MDEFENIIDDFIATIGLFFCAAIALITFPVWIIPYGIYKLVKRLR